MTANTPLDHLPRYVTSLWVAIDALKAGELAPSEMASPRFEETPYDQTLVCVDQETRDFFTQNLADPPADPGYERLMQASMPCKQ